MKTKTILLLLSAFPLCAADPASNAALRKQCEDKELAAMDRQGQLIALQKQEKSLKITASVTKDERKRPAWRKGKSKILLSLPLDSTQGWFGVPAKKGCTLAVSKVDSRPVFDCGINHFQTYCRSLRDLPAGKTIVIHVKMKCENVKAVRPGGGTRVGMMVWTADKKTLWPSAPVQTGTRDWMDVRLKVELPGNITGGRLMLGLAGGEGRVFFRDLVIEELL